MGTLSPGERGIQKHVNDTGSEDSPEDITKAQEDARRLRNLLQWRQSFDEAKDPQVRSQLIDELKRGAGTDFPRIGGMDGLGIATVEAGQQPMVFHIMGQDAPAQRQPSMQFKILGNDTTSLSGGEMPAAAATTTPQSTSDNETGAVTGRTAVPAPRSQLVRTPEDVETSKKMLRMGAETGGAFLGGSLGGMAGGAFGGPPGAAVGMRAGEAVGAGAGSLLSETFDPSKEPFREAAKTAGITLGTGVIASGATGILRKLIGKPHEGGLELIKLMEKEGKVPLPGAVLESEFIRNSQSFGSAAFGTNELLKKAQSEMEGVTSKAVTDYISGFQRFHDTSKLLFRDVDAALATPLPGTTQALHGNPLSGSASLPVSAPGAKWMLKGDEQARDAMIDVINNWISRTGRTDAMPTGLQKMYAWAQGGPRPNFTFEETQQVYEALFNKARALDFAARNRDVTEIAGTNTAAYVREQAQRVKKAFDDQIDNAIASKSISADTKLKLQAARSSWNSWLEGQEMERMLGAATKDIEGNGVVSGTRLMSEIDKLARLDDKVGTRTISPATLANLRKYALAAKAVEDSGRQGAYVLAGRVGQVVGLTAITSGGLISGIASLPLIGPHVLAYTFSNPKAASLIIRGLKLQPGSAEAARASRELFTIWEKEGLVGTDKPGEPE